MEYFGYFRFLFEYESFEKYVYGIETWRIVDWTKARRSQLYWIGSVHSKNEKNLAINKIHSSVNIIAI